MGTLIFGALAQVPALLAAWLQIRAARERFTLQVDIETYVDKIQDEDAKLRVAGDATSIARADVLRDRALSAAGIIGNLPALVPTPSVASAEGPAGADGGRPVHTAG